MAEKLRIALVGCGHRGIHVSSLFRDHPAWTVAAFMDIFPERASAAAEQLGLADAAIFGDFDEMLREGGLDAVLITCDPTLQIDLACRAMQSGLHACTEVPAAFSIEECWNLVKTVEKTGRQYVLLEQARYWGFIEEWARMNARGEFGHVCLAQGEYVHYERNWNSWINADTGEMSGELTPPAGWNARPSWRYEVLSDPIYYLPHTLSPLLKVLDDRVVRVSCMGTRRRSYTYEDVELPWRDIEYALMHTEKDTVLLAGAGFSLPSVRRGATGAHWYEVRGTKASVTSPRCIDDSFRLWRQGEDTYAPVELSTVPLEATAEQAKSGHGGADFKPVDSFTRAILDGTPPEVDAYRAVETAAPAILAAESARQGGALLEVPQFRPDKRS